MCPANVEKLTEPPIYCSPDYHNTGETVLQEEAQLAEYLSLYPPTYVANMATANIALLVQNEVICPSQHQHDVGE